MYKRIKSNIANHDTLTLSVVLFLTALVVRIIIFFQWPVISNDAVFYATLAKSILLGGSEHTDSTSFFSIYPFLIAFSYTIIPDWEIAGKAVSILSGSLAVIPLFILFSKLMDKRVAIIAGFLYVFGPRFVEYSTDILRESTFWLFFFTSLCFSWKGIYGMRLFYMTLAVIFAGLSFATRIEGIAIFPIIILWICFAVYSKEISLKNGFKTFAVLALIIPVLLLSTIMFMDHGSWSWVLEKFLEKGEYLLEGKVVSNLQINGVEAARDLPFSIRLLYELAEKYKYLIFTAEIIFKTLKSMTVVPVILLLVGLFLRKTIPFTRNEIYLIIWVGTFFIVSIYYMKGTNYFSTRHGLLLGIPALAFAGAGLLELRTKISNWFSSLRGSSELTKPILTALICLIFIILFMQSITSLREDKMGLRSAGIELKQKGFGGSVLVIQPSLSRLAFYADSDYITIQGKISAEGLVSVMKTNKANILVVNLDTIEKVVTNFDKIISSLKFHRIEFKYSNDNLQKSLAAYKYIP